MRVLVVDDSERVRKTLATGLKACGMTVETAADGAEALSLVNVLPFDLVVLDLMMPRMDGTQVLQALRTQSAKPRILVLSARDQVQDRVDSLNLGADDYLVKPFAFEELLARLLALGWRSVADASPEISRGRLVMDTATRLAPSSALQAGEALPVDRKAQPGMGKRLRPGLCTGRVWQIHPAERLAQPVCSPLNLAFAG